MKRSTRVRNHLRSNVVGYVAMFFAIGGGTAWATHPGGANTISTGDIQNEQVFTQDLANNNMTSLDIRDDTLGSGGLQAIDLRADSVGTQEIQTDGVQASEIADNSIDSGEIAADSLFAGDLGIDSVGASEIAADGVGSSEIAADSVGSSEIASSVVGSDELDSVHEHFGPSTNVVDGTAHDGIYAPSTSTVSCGVGEDLLSVSVDWTALGGHNEVMTSGVDSITRGEPDSATVRVGYDGGAGPGTYVAVATCIF